MRGSRAKETLNLWIVVVLYYDCTVGYCNQKREICWGGEQMGIFFFKFCHEDNSRSVCVFRFNMLTAVLLYISGKKWCLSLSVNA